MKIKNNSVFLTLLILLMTATQSICWGEPQQNQAVGHLTLVIGQAYATNSQGQKRRLQRAESVYVGDTIETTQGGHVHIRFIDDGRISVRPESQLKIESYHYDPKTPKNSQIRFFLQKGVLRSISGKATEADHERYRMNTPIAALGVLGTDYVVRTNLETTWAAVYSGSISLAPIENGCQYGGLGTCKNGTKLTAKMGDMYLEVNAGDITTALKSQISEIQNAQIDRSRRQNDETVQNNNDDTQIMQQAAVVEGAYRNENDNGLASNEKLAILSTATSSEFLARSSELSWVRWPWQSAEAADTVTQPRSQQTEDKITITNSYAGLFRAPNTLLELQPQNGVFNFSLRRSHVVFIKNGDPRQVAEAARLDKANLQIDFARKQFKTQLEIFNQQTGSVGLSVTGSVSKDGLFRGSNATGNVAGALSLDGKDVGLQFNKDLENGRLQGITEWQR